jgi:hypothetical protein
MHAVLSDYWDKYPPEIVSFELLVDEPIPIPSTVELRMHIRDAVGIMYLSFSEPLQ